MYLNANNINNYNYLVSNHYKINNQVSIIVKLGINPLSDYYFSNIKKLYKCLLVNVIAAFVTCSVILYINLQVKHNITRIEQLDDNLFDTNNDTNKMNNALLLYKEASKNLNTFFIKKATEEYIKQQLKYDPEQEIELDKIYPSNYLFPICFTKHAQAEIDTKALINYLKKYFAEYFLYTAIKYECNIDKLIVDCGQHVFYQIIFSLLYNLINFMKDQSKIPKSLCITFTTHKLTIFYDGFLLTEQIMVNLSNSMIVETIDPFLLNCSKIFQSLKEHGLNYAII